jgi:hypothetical protein
MKKKSVKLNRKIFICLLIFTMLVLPVSSSLCLAQDAANAPAGASTESSAGVAAAGNAGSGGLAGLSTLSKVGIVVAAFAIVAIIVVASDAAPANSN